MVNESRPTQSSGTRVIVGIMVLALGAAAFAWWYRVQATHRAMALWGADRARLIQTGKPVQALRFSPPRATDDEELIEAGDQALRVEELRDISQVGGLLHLRQALLEDRSFGPQRQERAGEANRTEWAFGLRIGQGQTAMLLVFSRDFARMAVVEHGSIGRVVSISKVPTAAGLANFFAEQFEDGQFP